jgi:hypothetical protein
MGKVTFHRPSGFAVNDRDTHSVYDTAVDAGKRRLEPLTETELEGKEWAIEVDRL